jgi:hypothetical protein
MGEKKQSPTTPDQSDMANAGTTGIALGSGTPIVHLEYQHPIDINAPLISWKGEGRCCLVHNIFNNQAYSSSCSLASLSSL